MKSRAINPSNYGWIEAKLDETEIDLIWNQINETKGKDMKYTLVGQIDKSFEFFDSDDRYIEECIVKPLVNQYGQEFSHDHTPIPINDTFRPYLRNLWVNYQGENEYNPVHNHHGLYSFVIWLRQPVSYKENAKHYTSKNASDSFNCTFGFQYINTMGVIESYLYKLDPTYEGTMLLFPSKLLHHVNPFYNSDQQRVSVSGNIFLGKPDE